jgi:hypothetical protein
MKKAIPYVIGAVGGVLVGAALIANVPAVAGLASKLKFTS